MDGAEVLESDVRFYLRCPIRTASGVAKEKQGRRTGKSCHTSSAVAQFRLTSFLFCLRTSKKNPFPPSGAKRWNGFKLTQITQNARQHRRGRWFEVCRSSGCSLFCFVFLPRRVNFFSHLLATRHIPLFTTSRLCAMWEETKARIRSIFLVRSGDSVLARRASIV